MPVAMLLIGILTVIMMSISYYPLKKAKELERKNGAYDSTTNTFVDTRGRSSSFRATNYSEEENKIKLENIEIALIRTCRSVSTIAHANGCADWNKASYIWSYVGNIGGTGQLDNVSTGSTSAVFSCTTNDKFGRGLFQNSVPSNIIVGQGYYYDFSGMSDNNTDPCGYTNIVRY